jgi:predicted XRE-type DNA-binding protein
MSRLSFEDAVDIWLRRWAGQFQHAIAAIYEVNQGRINEVLKGKLHPGSEKIAATKRST